MNRSSYDLWCLSKDKGNLEFYEDEDFRDDYTENELSKKHQLVHSMIKEPMHSAIVSTDYDNYRTLSLGCGPGSDMLSQMQVFQSVCRTKGLDSLDVKLTGVDLFDWPMDEFVNRRSEIEARGPIEDFPAKFYFDCDMEEYVRIVQMKGRHFDFIIMSFAEVKTKIEFVGRQLPQLLYDGGRIFVIDNDIEPVLRLENFGFRLTSRINRSVCLVYGEPDAETDSSDPEESNPWEDMFGF